MWDLTINSRGVVQPMEDGFFEFADNMVSRFNENEYMIIGDYRIDRLCYEGLPNYKKKIDKFLKSKELM